jgi:cyclase
MQKLTENIYASTGRRGSNNSVIKTEEGMVLIDTPMLPEYAIKLRDEISGMGKIRYIINTEPHADHFNGNCFFDGTVIGHEGTRAAVLSSTKKQIEAFLKQIAPQNLPLLREFYYRPPAITFSGRMSLYLGGHTFELIPMPGHSPYQAAVYIPEEKALFSSDNIVGDIPYFHQAIPDQWFQALDLIEKMDIKIIVPGHGEVTDLSAVPRMRKVLHAWIDAAKDAIGKGLTLEEAQKAITMEELYPNINEDAHLQQVRDMNISNLYRIYHKA